MFFQHRLDNRNNKNDNSKLHEGSSQSPQAQYSQQAQQSEAQREVALGPRRQRRHEAPGHRSDDVIQELATDVLRANGARARDPLPGPESRQPEVDGDVDEEHLEARCGRWYFHTPLF
jgi:hypothetical protein